MSTKKYNDFAAGSGAADSKILLIADPSTGALEKITLADLGVYFGATGGGGGALAPTVTLEATTSTNVQAVFSTSMSAVTTAGWSFKKSGSAWTVSSVSGSGTTWNFTMATKAAKGEALLGSYDSTTGSTTDGSHEVVTFTDASVTNSIGYESISSSFFTATSITNVTIKDATNKLYVDLVNYGLDTKIKCLYPFVGGNATAHSFNLLNTAAYQISYGGTALTHDANGVTGTSGYADTSFVPSVALSNKYSVSIFAYNRTNANGRIVSGYSSGAGWQQIAQLTGNMHMKAGNSQVVEVNVANADAKGCYIVSRTSATVLKGWRNGTQLGSTVTTDVTSTDGLTANSLVLFDEKVNSTTQGQYSTLNVALWGIGDGLNDTEVANLNTAIVAFQTALSRNV